MFFKPDPSCFLYYLNSSFNTATVKDNVSRKQVLPKGSFTKESAKKLLQDAGNGVEIIMVKDIKEGEELFGDYPFSPEPVEKRGWGRRSGGGSRA